ncbi:MAG: translation initiation factor IF-2 [Planctomycetes bacterium]|nr:translation initiation factor IF-2 [Planctomycetota bacterium]
MSKIAKVRVSQLAKELGVPSKDIVARCTAEGIDDVKQPQSTVSAGLAATIREWFAGAGGVAVAEAPAVEKVASEAAEADAPKKARKGVAKKMVEAPKAEPAPALVSKPVEPKPVEAKPIEGKPADAKPGGTKPVKVKVAPIVTPPVAPTVAKPVTPVQPPRQGGEGGAPIKPTTPQPARGPVLKPGPPPVINVPARPKEVRPGGPRLEQPVKTAMSGPKLIRVEQPENLPTPRPRTGPPMSRGPRLGGAGAGAGGGAGVAPPGGRTFGGDRRGGAGARRAKAGEGGRAREEGGGGGGGGAEPWRAQDLAEREDRLNRSGGFFRSHKRTPDRRVPVPAQKQAGPPQGPVKIAEPIHIKELSAVTGVKAGDILKKLFLQGTVATINSVITADQALETMLEFSVELEIEEAKSAAEIIEAGFKERVRSDERPRSPVVTIMGHVDHGKTSLLDKIRNTNVAAGEAGGITQATRAFQTRVKAGENDRVVTFIDTPGHEAFTNMRSRGAKVTDIVVLVVAADDGVMPQTVESINHAKAAGVPIVVALNKIDRPEATENNIQRIFGQLAEHGLNPVPWGGTTEVIKTSATAGTGIQELLDVLDYQAELLGLKADFKGVAQGTVLEAQVEEGRGPVARLIVQEGLLKRGDFVVIGRAFGRVRDIVNDRGQRVDEAGPSTPVAISGIDLLPDAGDSFFCTKSVKEAEEAAEERRRIERERELAAPKITLDNIFEHMGKAQVKEVALVVKADVQGSAEALRSELAKIKTDEVAVSVKHCAVGGINESDVALASATGAIIVGFNVTSSGKARTQAEQKNVEIRLYEVIYDLVDDVTKAASGLLAPEIKLEVLGHAEVRQVFKISKVGMIAGCYVTDGTIERNAQIRVTRNGIVVEKDRRLEQLKRFKDDAKEVRAGNECGMKIVGYDDIKEGDVLECYRTTTVSRSMPEKR